MSNKTAEQTNLLLEKCNGDHKAVIAYLLGHIDVVETELNYIADCLKNGKSPLVSNKKLEDKLEDK